MPASEVKKFLTSHRNVWQSGEYGLNAQGPVLAESAYPRDPVEA